MKIKDRLKLNKMWKKLALGALLTVIFVMFIMGIISREIDRYYGLKDFEADLESMVNVAASSLEGPLWNLNEETLTSICDSILQIESVSRIVVKDTSLGIIYSKENSGKKHSEDRLVTSVKNIVHNNKVIGSIEFTMTKYYIEEQLNRNTQIHIVEMVIIIVLLMLTLFVIISKITKPLSNLKAALEEVTGDKVMQIEVKSDDEIGDLTKSFNDMSSKIFDAKQSIKKLNEELEVKVVLRTEELNIKNNELRESIETIKATEEELLASNQSLSNTLRELHEVQDLLVESGKMALLGELVAGVAHEINTPVGVSLTVSSYMESETKQLLAKVKEDRLTKKEFITFLENIEESAASLVRNLLRAGELISSFKQVAVDQTSRSVRRFHVHEYVDEILTNLHSQYKNRQLVINNNCPDELDIVSYPGAYSQILTNLVMNSLVHGFNEDEEGTISIDAKRVGDTLEITYHDNGQGIPEEFIDKVFNPFFTTKRGFGGTGLGLNITYNIIVNILKGNIVCHSKPNKGTTFIITVPYNHPDINETLY